MTPAATMGPSWRDGGDDDVDGDDRGSESEGTTVAGGSAPQSPCLWLHAKRHGTSGDADAGDGAVGDSSKENRRVHSDRSTSVRAPLEAFFAVKPASLIAVLAETAKKSVERACGSSPPPQTPPSLQRSSSDVVAAKGSPLLESLKVEMTSQDLSLLSPLPSLSPSLWFSPVGSQASAPRSPPSPGPASTPAQVSDVPASSSFIEPMIPAKSRTLLLSPMSQLNVLSQISEMADRQAQKAATPAPARALRASGDGSSSDGQSPTHSARRHAWAPARKEGKKRARSESSAPQAAMKAPMQRRKAATTAKEQIRLSEAIARDMLDWETCSEDIFLENSDCGSQDDPWVFADISDSDFE